MSIKAKRQLVRQSDGAVVIKELVVADSFWMRLRGLQFRKPLSRDEAWMLAPCSSIHTCFMSFPIDVIMLDREGMVIDIRHHLKPWRLYVCARGTRTVVETATGAVELSIGDSLQVR